MTLRLIFAALGLFLMVLGMLYVSVLDLLLGAVFLGFSIYDIYRNSLHEKQDDQDKKTP